MAVRVKRDGREITSAVRRKASGRIVNNGHKKRARKLPFAERRGLLERTSNFQITSQNPSKGEILTFFSGMYHGLDNVPIGLLKAVGLGFGFEVRPVVADPRLLKKRYLEWYLQNKGERIFSTRLLSVVDSETKRVTMNDFYDEHSFGKKNVGGYSVRIPPSGNWESETEELQREVIFFCIHVVLKHIDPRKVTIEELKREIPGLVKHFGNMVNLLDFAYQGSHIYF
ncbi:MAG: hypothetical protein PHU63_00515 [Candidatus ainarchaeum sp.]|nr:hypothetical protein [Candidatus ainarchaeum sp.]